MIAARYKWGLLLLMVLFGSLAYAIYDFKNAKAITQTVVNKNYQLKWHDCTFPLPKLLKVDCATLITPTHTGEFQLPVAIIRYTKNDKRTDSLLYLQGGPGAAAGINEDGMTNWEYFQDFSNAKRDIIIMDRRGTGGSYPKLECADFKRFNEKVLGQSLAAASEMAKGFAIVKKCFANNAGFNINHYGTKSSAQDIRALITQLSLPSWNMLGISYGSRLAMEVVTGASDVKNIGLKALVLDSVYPPEVGGVHEWPTTLNRALQRFFTACKHHVPCAKAWQINKNLFPQNDLQASFQETLTTLKSTPIRTVVTRLNEWPLNVVVNDHLFLSAVFSASYDRHRWLDVVNAMHAVKTGEKEPVKKLITSFVNQVLSTSITDLVFMAVDCQDNSIGKIGDYQKQVELYSYLTPYIEGLWENQICHLWENKGAALTLLNLKRETFQLPTLILAGSFDPITPIEWAHDVVGFWPHAQIQEFEDTGHAVLGTNACALEALGAFLDAPNLPWHAC